MPRYFFHLRSGRRLLPDDEGIELRNRTAARDEALAVVGDLTNPRIKVRSTALGKLVPRGGGRTESVLPHANRSSRARACNPGSPRAGRRGARVETGPGGKPSPRGSPRRGPDGRDFPAENGAPPTE